MAERPAQDMWTAAAVREHFKADVLLEAWLRSHQSEKSDVRRLATSAAVELQRSSVQGEDAEGVPNLRLPLHRRLAVLKAAGRSEALAALRSVEQPTLTERTFQSALAGEPLVPDRDDRTQLMALDVVAPWARAAGVALSFDTEAVARQIARSDFLRLMAGADLHRFIGRNRLMATLDEWWRMPDGDEAVALMVEGPGGIGKSIAISRFLANLTEAAADARLDAIFHIDFDKPSLYGARVATILNECIRQAATYWGPLQSEDLAALLRETTSGDADLESISTGSRGGEYGQVNEASARKLVSLLTVADRQPMIAIFVDSFEQVDLERGPRETLSRTGIMLREAGARVRMIYASRSFPRPGEISRLAPLRLNQFSTDEARSYLENEAARCGVPIRKADIGGVIAAVGRSPLSLRMAVALLEREGASIDPAQWGLKTERSPEFVQATLYDRILQRMRNPELRKIAFPGLLVRRLTEDVIEEVLAGACDLDVTRSLSHLMEEARLEGQLFVTDPADPKALLHRPDVRALMLPTIDRIVAPQRAQAINEAAVAYYERGTTPLHRIEELYHRLRLGQPDALLDARWIDGAARRLRPVIREFPASGRSYLRRRLYSPRSDAPARLEGVAAGSFRGELDRWRGLRDDARRDLQEGNLSASVQEAIEKAGVDVVDGPLGDVVAQRMLRQGRFDELLEGARRLLAAKPAFAEGYVGVLSTAAAVLEGRGHLREAETFWLRARQTSKLLGDEVRLAALVGVIRIRRKTGDAGGLRQSAMKEAVSLVVALGSRLLYDQRVLARETAAELCETLTAEDAGSDRHGAVFELVQVVVRLNEAFPSAVNDKRRLAHVVARLSEDARATKLDTLNSIVEKLMYSGEGFAKTLMHVLREEVDWTLSRAVTIANDRTGARPSGTAAGKRRIEIAFPSRAPDLAGRLADSLARDIRRFVRDDRARVIVAMARAEASAMDFGSILTMSVGDAALTQLAQAIVDWARRTGTPSITLNGRRLDELEDRDAASIGAALRRAADAAR